jgi:hypothetical protein
MKRIFLVSCYILAAIAMASCTNDEVETAPKTNEQQAINDDPQEPGDGQTGQTPIPPPKP